MSLDWVRNLSRVPKNRYAIGFALVLAWCSLGPAIDTRAADCEHGEQSRTKPPIAAEDAPQDTNLGDDRSGAPSETQPGEQVPIKEEKTPGKEAANSAKQGEWMFAPIPVSSPAIGSGLEFAVARLFPFSKKDEVSPASAVGLAGIFTNNGSRGIAIGGKLYMKEDRYRMAIGIANASINFDVYGIGAAGGRRGIFIPLNVDGRAGIAEFLYRIRKSMYLGLRGQYRNATLSLNQDRLDSSDITTEPPDQVANVIQQIQNQLLHQTTVSIGPRFQWDTRDSTFYPKHGFLTEVASDFFLTGLGSKWTYQYYKASLNKYSALSEHQVLAFRVMACAAAGSRVPIYDLCLFGTMNDLRGYTGGRFQDRRMFATQAEYRLMFPAKGFWGRFGVVAFAGVGAVEDKFTNIGFSDLLPAGGGGLRFRLLKKYPVNFRVDYGQGNDGHTLSIGVLEAF